MTAVNSYKSEIGCFLLSSLTGVALITSNVLWSKSTIYILPSRFPTMIPHSIVISGTDPEINQGGWPSYQFQVGSFIYCEQYIYHSSNIERYEVGGLAVLAYHA